MLYQIHRSSAGRHGSFWSGLVSQDLGPAEIKLTIRPS